MQCAKYVYKIQNDVLCKGSVYYFLSYVNKWDQNAFSLFLALNTVKWGDFEQRTTADLNQKRIYFCYSAQFQRIVDN